VVVFIEFIVIVVATSVADFGGVGADADAKGKDG